MFLIGIELWKEGQAYLNKDFIIHFYPFKGKLKIALEWVPISLPILSFLFFFHWGHHQLLVVFLYEVLGINSVVLAFSNNNDLFCLQSILGL